MTVTYVWGKPKFLLFRNVSPLIWLFFFPLGCLIEAVNLKSSNRNPVVQEFESKYTMLQGGWAPSSGHVVVLQSAQDMLGVSAVLGVIWVLSSVPVRAMYHSVWATSPDTCLLLGLCLNNKEIV